MFNFSIPELILILAIALVIFGPSKLPEVGKALGRSLKEFREATTHNHLNEPNTTIEENTEKKT